MDFLLVFILIAVVYLLAITYMHHCLMRMCEDSEELENTPRNVLGIVYDHRPANSINKDCK